MALNSSSVEKDAESLGMPTDVKHEEVTGRGGLTREELDFVENFPEEKRKKVLAKIDVSIMSYCQ
jgi:hypothetical protein